MGWFRKNKNDGPDVGFRVCASCHSRNGAEGDFCERCQGDLGEKIYCPCGRRRRSGELVCGFCGLDQHGRRGGEQERNWPIWQREGGDWVTVLSNLPLSRTGTDRFCILPGSVALIFQDQSYRGSLWPGNHSYSALPGLLMDFDPKRQFHGLLMDIAPSELLVGVPDLVALDEDQRANRYQLNLALRLELTDPDLFREQVVGEKKNLLPDWPAGRWGDRITDLMKRFFCDRPRAEKETRLAARIELVLLDALETEFDECGLKLAHVTLNLGDGEAVFRQERADYLHKLRNRFTALENRRSLWELERRERRADRSEAEERAGEDFGANLQERRQKLVFRRELAEVLNAATNQEIDLGEQELEHWQRHRGFLLHRRDKLLLHRECRRQQELKERRFDLEKRGEDLRYNRQADDLALETLRQNAATAQARVGLFEELCAARTREKVAGLEARGEWESFQHAFDKEALLRTREREELQSALKRDREQEDRSYRHTLELLNLNRSLELARLRDLLNEYQESARQRRELQQGEHGLKLRRIQAHIEEVDAKSRNLDDIVKTQMTVDQELYQREKQLAIERREGEFKTEDLRRMTALQRERLDMALAARERKNEMTVRLKEREDQLAMKRADQLNGLKLQTQIALSGDREVRESLLAYHREEAGHWLKNADLPEDRLKRYYEQELRHQHSFRQQEKEHHHRVEQFYERQIKGERGERNEERKHGRDLLDGAAHIAGAKKERFEKGVVCCPFCRKDTVVTRTIRKCCHCGQAAGG